MGAIIGSINILTDIDPVLTVDEYAKLSPSQVYERWDRMFDKYHEDHGKPLPYYITESELMISNFSN